MLLKALEKASEVSWGVCYVVWWSSAQTESTMFHHGHISVTNFTKPKIDTLPHHSASHQQPDHDLLTQGGGRAAFVHRGVPESTKKESSI